MAVIPEFMAAYSKEVVTRFRNSEEHQEKNLSIARQNYQRQLEESENKLWVIERDLQRTKMAYESAELEVRCLTKLGKCKHCASNISISILKKGDDSWDMRCSDCNSRLY